MFMLRQSFRIIYSSNAHKQINCTRNVQRWVSPTLREIKKRREMLGPDPVQPRKQFIEWNNNAELFAFGKRLNEEFDMSILQRAFTDRSYIVQEELRQQQVGIDNPITNLKDNQELAVKGEQLLSDYINVFLTSQLPNFPEAGISALQLYLMSEEMLSNVSLHLGTSDLILSSEYPVNSATLAATFKAVVAALAASSGTERAFEFIRDFVCTQLNQKDINDLWNPDKPIELLSDICRTMKLGEPEPRLIGEAGKNTIMAAYHVGIYCEKKLLGTGFGENVDIAIETASRNCLTRLCGTNNMRPLNFKISTQKCYEILQQQKKSETL